MIPKHKFLSLVSLDRLVHVCFESGSGSVGSRGLRALGLIRATPVRIAGTASTARRKAVLAGFAKEASLKWRGDANPNLQR